MNVTVKTAGDEAEEPVRAGILDFENEESLLTAHNIACVAATVQQSWQRGDHDLSKTRPIWLEGAMFSASLAGFTQHDVDALWVAGVTQAGRATRH